MVRACSRGDSGAQDGSGERDHPARGCPTWRGTSVTAPDGQAATSFPPLYSGGVSLPRTWASSAARRAGRCMNPLTRRNWHFASAMPAAHQRSAIWPSLQRFTLVAWSLPISIIDSMGLVERSVRARVGGTPRRLTVRVSARPSRSDPAAPGWALSRSRARPPGWPWQLRGQSRGRPLASGGQRWPPADRAGGR